MDLAVRWFKTRKKASRPKRCCAPEHLGEQFEHVPGGAHAFGRGSEHQHDRVGDPQRLEHPGRFARGQVEQDGRVVVTVGLVDQVVELGLLAVPHGGGIGGGFGRGDDHIQPVCGGLDGILEAAFAALQVFGGAGGKARPQAQGRIGAGRSKEKSSERIERRAASSKPMASARVERPVPPCAETKAITRVPTAEMVVPIAMPWSGEVERLRAISVSIGVRP